ncbi:MAG: tetratricopeptide repeat protein [Oligoflexales bacterium]
MFSKYRQFSSLRLLLVVGAFCLADASGFAKGAKNAQNKAKAPTMEDYNKYTSSDETYQAPPEIQKKADDIRLKTISSINTLIDSSGKKQNRFELLLRLGELHSERHDYMRDLEMTDYDTAYATWVKNDKKGKEPALKTDKSKAELLKSSAAFRRLVTEFPDHPRTDAALYSLAKTLARLGNENAVLYFNQMIKKFPKSPLIPEAYLAMGEYYFDAYKIPEAMAAYKSAIKYKNSPVYPYAVYKLGWSYYNSNVKSEGQQRDNIKKSLAAFKLVVKLSDKDTAKRRLNLRQEAINDLVMVWAETEAVDEAWSYFSKIGEKEAFYNVLERLGNTYVDQGKDEKAITIFTKLLREAPTRERNPQVYVKLIALHDQMGDLAGVVKDLKEMGRLYVVASDWSKANQKSADVIKEASESTEHNMHRYGALYHQKGQKLKKDAYLKTASDIYQVYLGTFPQNPNAYEIRFYLADIYFHFDKFAEASEEYTKVVQADTKKGKYLKDAAYNAVITMNKLDQKTKYAKVPDPGKVTSPMEVPDVKKKLIMKIDAYVELLPKEKDGHPMRFTAAETFFAYGHYEEALKRFDKIATEIPGTKQGDSAVKVILAFYSERKDWDNLIAKSRRFLGEKAITSVELKKVITASLMAGTFQKALDMEKDKKYLASADLFMSYQKEFPNDKDSDKALYNASLSYYKIGEVEKGIAADKLLLSAYAKSDLRGRAMMDLAQTYEALAEFKDAAYYYQSFALSYPKEEKASGALFNAAILYKGLNEHKQSITLFERFASEYSKDPLSSDALFEVGATKEKQEDFAGAVQAYERYLTKADDKKEVDRVASVEAKIAVLYLKVGNNRAGEKQLAAVQRKLSADRTNAKFLARETIAQYMFDSLEKDFNHFKTLKINSAKSIEKDVTEKQKSLVKLAKNYEAVIGIASGEYVVASLYRLGEIHEQFAKELMAAPAPEGANQVELDQYRSSIEKVAIPLKEESLNFYETAYKKSAEVQTFTEWTRKAYAKMADVAPQKHRPVDEKALNASYVGYHMQVEDSVSKLLK